MAQALHNYESVTVFRSRLNGAETFESPEAARDADRESASLILGAANSATIELAVEGFAADEYERIRIAIAILAEWQLEAPQKDKEFNTAP